jgi:hypothetical protein
MSTIESLRVERRLIRDALAAFEEALALAQSSAVVQGIHRAVMALLEMYLRHGAQAPGACSSRPWNTQRAATMTDHAEPAVILRDLRAFDAAWQEAPTPSLASHLRHLIDELREGLDEDERSVA